VIGSRNRPAAVSKCLPQVGELRCETHQQWRTAFDAQNLGRPMRKRWHSFPQTMALRDGGAASTARSWLTPLTALPGFRPTAQVGNTTAINS
jgi:hypothetical protein